MNSAFSVKAFVILVIGWFSRPADWIKLGQKHNLRLARDFGITRNVCCSFHDAGKH